MRETIRELQPTRIGHGVRSSEDHSLLGLLRAEHIHLEVCPSSNVQTNIYESYADHPIYRLYEAGVSLGINTDTRTITPTTLTQEYEHIQQVFGWSAQHFLQCNLYALQAAFLSQEKKRAMEQRLRQGYAEVEGTGG